MNSRAWPPGCEISDPMCPPPIAQEIDLHVIDLKSLREERRILRAHRAFTPNDECFFIFLDVSRDFVARWVSKASHLYSWLLLNISACWYESIAMQRCLPLLALRGIAPTIHTFVNVILEKQMVDFSLCCVYIKWSRGQARLHLGSSLQYLSGASGTRRRSELCRVQPGRPGAAAVCQRWLHHQGVALASDGASVAGRGAPVEAPQSPFKLAESQQELCERKAVIEVRSEFMSSVCLPSVVSAWDHSAIILHVFSKQEMSWVWWDSPGQKSPQTAVLWTQVFVYVINVHRTDIQSCC